MANKFVFKRIEKKYLLNEDQYNMLLERIKNMAAVDKYGKSTILNIYFDTPDFALIRRSLEKPLYKEKLRFRSYGTPMNSTTTFIEIKKKYKGVVYKRRIEAPFTEARNYLYDDIPMCKDTQIGHEIDYFKKIYNGLSPAMAISYDRIAMAGIEDPELRLTFDTNLRYRLDDLDLSYGNAGKEILKSGEHLLEIKVAGSMPLELARTLSELRIFPASFSKYGRAFNMALSAKEISFPGTSEILPYGEGVFIPVCA